MKYVVTLFSLLLISTVSFAQGATAPVAPAAPAAPASPSDSGVSNSTSASQDVVISPEAAPADQGSFDAEFESGKNACEAAKKRFLQNKKENKKQRGILGKIQDDKAHEELKKCMHDLKKSLKAKYGHSQRYYKHSRHKDL